MSPVTAADAGQRGSPVTVTLLATGGTIEKTYEPHSGALTLAVPVLEMLLDTLECPDVDVRVERLMAKDSLDMDDADRATIVEATAAVQAAGQTDAVVITHGTDTLADTAAALVAGLDVPAVPVVLTGAMRPYRVADSDAAQNVAQALMAARLLAPGVYAVMHGRAVPGDCVVKDYARLTIAAGR